MVEFVKEDLLEALAALSRHYGADPAFVLAGGGNTSAKLGQRLFIKASGYPLATITPEGFVEMERPPLEALLHRDLGNDRNVREERFKEAVLAARVDPQSKLRPSVEVVLHHLVPQRFVVHTHATVVNMYACCTASRELIRDLCGDEVLWLPSVDAGFVLARNLRDALEGYRQTTGRDCPRAVIMGNHGLVVCGDTPEEVREHTDWLLTRLGQYLASRPEQAAFGTVSRIEVTQVRQLVNVMGPALRGLLGNDESLKVVTFDDSAEVMDLVGGSAGQAAATGGPLTPDQIVYCRAWPLWFAAEMDETSSALVERLRQAVNAHEKRTEFPPQVVLVQGLGLFAAGDDIAAAETIRAVYVDAIKVMAGARKLGGIRYLDPELCDFFEHWEAEAYRRSIARGSRRAGRAAGKIAVVTGAAQGFGLEIAQDLADQGAHVVLTDVNQEGAAQAAVQLNARHGAGRAVALAINVTDGASVGQAIDQAVRAFGGFDLFISNAGVLRAGSVKTQPEKEFDFVTAVNYKGYFVCVQQAVPILAVQHQARSAYWSDIIQINSKSGLQGSNRNSAYSGSKFGSIGLTQSFAMELVEDGIKVNAVCPGNFFDGPLWSDPNNGLFVQYLRSGKVPGAKTIDDVKRFYEAKVPMGRGCTTADVMKAIYYLMDQKYETGQAVPVTGGQVMLS
jgi:rhamnose utilization protein RhaD (predicted bifunctional aldolase and dehydrogenase)/NAD(P)-dependent dehydrogenase (short-subunit alcohol dehydrogenase family)